MEKGQKKFKTRGLTKNEKILLSLLFIVILFHLCYRVVYTPQKEKLITLKTKELEYKVKIEKINSILRKENSINKEWQDLNREKEEIISQYFPTLDQAQIIYILNDLIENDNISISDLNFNRPEFSELGGFKIKSMDVLIPYSGDYEGILDTLNSIKESPRKILVDNLFMDRAMDKKLSGNMSLKIYSLQGIAKSEKDIVYIDTVPVDTVSKDHKDTPFVGHDFKVDQEYDKRTNFEVDGQMEIHKQIPEMKPYIVENLLDFEDENNYFIPSQKYVKGNVSLSNKSKFKKHSLKLEYNILAVEKENCAFIDVTRNNVLLKYPPNIIGIWVYSYDYSPAIIGLGFKGQMGEEILLPICEGIGWTGWRYIETPPPQDINIYPIKLESLYLEILEDREDCGVILLDKLDAIYKRNVSEDGSDMSISQHIFHIVEKGETIDLISGKYYGTNKYIKEIMKLNEIESDEILKDGKVLVLKKH